MVGTEMLALGVRDTNSEILKEDLLAMGYEVAAVSVVADELGVLSGLVRSALSRSHLTVIGGGLGPTRDDRTRVAVAAALGVPLRSSPHAWQSIRRWYDARGRRPGPGARRQAQVPRGAECLPNPVGSAPGIWWRGRGRSLAVLPGVPTEFERMWGDQVRPRLWRTAGEVPRVSFRIGGLTESEVDSRLAQLYRRTRLDVTMLAKTGFIEVHLRGRKADRPTRDAVQRAAAYVRARLGKAVFAEGSETLEQVVGRRLRERGETLALAESCTGGVLGARLTSIAGSSDYFRGGVIAYADEVKHRLLGVPQATLRRHGAVSAPVSRARAQSARRRLGCDWGLAITGVAGPGGGTAAKPVGCVFLGLAGSGRRPAVRRLKLVGTRETIRRRAAASALLWLYAQLRAGGRRR
jgi:nicotinamide-nucleotide amidase